MSFTDQIPIQDLTGLRPRAWLCVGPGFAREDLKLSIFQKGAAFISDVIVHPQDICLKILNVQGEAVLGPLARQEILRSLLGNSKVLSKVPELKRLKRQSSFYKKLDRSIQSGRMSFAHVEESFVYLQRLTERNGENPLRVEVQMISQAYEAWLGAYQLWDLPMLMRAAVENLQEGLPSDLKLPKKIVIFTAQGTESLEREFWETLGRYTEIQRIAPEKLTELPQNLSWERWHTLDDAADALADRLLECEDLSEQTVLTPDNPAVRRSIKRALEDRKIPVADPRDPTRLRWEEGIKWAMLPLDVVARGFERQKVVSWLRTHFFQPEFTQWVSEINTRGVRQGLESYQGGKLERAYSRLKELNDQFTGRKHCEELAEAHLTYLRAEIGSESERSDHLYWLLAFFEQAWKEFVADYKRVGTNTRKAPLLYWIERFQARLDEASPPVDRFKPREGVRLNRIGQAPLFEAKNLWLLGLPTNWLSGEGLGDYWFSEKEREVLSAEFSVRSSIQVREERIALLQSWMIAAEEITLMDAQYEWDGRERESLLPLLREIHPEPPEVREFGSHPRWIPSYGAMRPVPPLEVQLKTRWARGRNEILATEMDHYSRCAFRALASSRWKLREVRDPDMDLWPEVKGNILHKAVRILIESRDDEGQFSTTPQEALERAWASEKPKGLIKGKRLEDYTKSRMLLSLLAFCEKEREYVQRAGTKVLSLEGPELRLEYPGFSIIGIPDRIDEHPDGIFIMDYKTSSMLPKGKEMVELGYRLQLPFYALAAQKQLGREALGVQFVELNRKGGRGQGVFFKKYNGKNPGMLTNTRSKLNVLEIETADAWSQIESQLLSHAESFIQGKFPAKPKKSSECPTCPFIDVCGYRRITQVSDENDGEAQGD